MCGLAGIVHFGSGPGISSPQSVLKGMNDALRHRGPDAHGIWASSDGRAHLAHRRLSVIDLSAAANQPMHDASGRYSIVFNGEIYNFKALRTELVQQGVVFKTLSDTEVLLQAFIVNGTAAFAQFDGMFAVAIYDSVTGTLTLARDGAGEKPLYYAKTDDTLAFASELRPLLGVPGINAQLSETGVALYMALRYVPAPYSIVQGIRKLPPGTTLQVMADGTEHVENFFSFSGGNFAADSGQDPSVFAQRVEDALTASLEARLNSDVPLGAFLSSGVDSALACALLTKRMGRPLKTFSVGFAGDPDSEHAAAADIARALGTEHRELIFGADAFDDICNRIGDLLDEPNGDRSCVPTYLLSEFARAHVTVAISGDGGDELFAGYSRYQGFSHRYAKMQWPSAQEIPRAYFQAGLPVFPWQGILDVVPDGFSAVTDFADSFAPIFAAPNRSMVDGLRILDFESYLPGAVLAKVDRMSMRHALEVRTPYLNASLYALSRIAAPSALLGPEGQKAVLRRLVGKYLEKSHATAPKKGFGMPPSVFINNKERVAEALRQACGLLSETEFFKPRKTGAGQLPKWAGSNNNSAWATIVLAKWIESVGVKL